MTIISTSGSAEIAQAVAEVAATRRGRVLTVHAPDGARLLTEAGLDADVLVVQFPGASPGTVAEAEALVGELRSRIGPGRPVVLGLVDLDRAVPPMIWRDFLLDTLLPPLLGTRALLVVATETGAPRASDAAVGVEDRIRLLRAERGSPQRILDHLDAVAHALEPDEHLRHARRALALAKDDPRALARLGAAAEGVGWTGDALACAAAGSDPQLVVTRLRRYRSAPVASRLGLDVPDLDLEAALDALDPSTPWWRHERAELEALRGDHERALELAAGAPESAEVHRLRARSNEAVGRTDRAIAAYREAIRLQPRPEDLAELARLVPDAEEAVTLAAHAVLLGERHWLALGLALARRGDRLVGMRVAATEADAEALVEAFGVSPEEAERARAWATRPHWNRLEFVTAATGIDRQATDALVQRTS